MNNNIKTIEKYQKKEFMTKIETYFYNILIELEQELNIKIHPQINLSSIIKKNYQNKYINELISRTIDFAIFTSNYNKLLLLIEIDDKTHKYKSRRKRDRKINKITKIAKIKIIRFYTYYSNKPNYIKKRIKKELNKINNC